MYAVYQLFSNILYVLPFHHASPPPLDPRSREPISARAYLIGRPYGVGIPKPQSRCCIKIELSLPTSSCRLPMVCCSRSLSIVSCSTLVCSSLNHAFFR